jgi:hypothetical protein
MQKMVAGIPVTLKVNGEEHQLLVKPHQTLLGVATILVSPTSWGMMGPAAPAWLP